MPNSKGFSLITILLLILIAILGGWIYMADGDVPSIEQFGEIEPKYHSSLDINYLRSLDLQGSEINIEEELNPGSNYKRYIASYKSDGNKIFGLLTVPNQEPSEGGFKAIVFNHGYVPANQYVTTEKYVAYVDFLASRGFVVFKIDMRGHGNSEGRASGSYFSNGYTIDAINALKSLQKLEYVNPNSIGMWGHSMSGNLVLRAMLVSEEVKAAAIWAGAVYSYEDFVKYRLNDGSYTGRRSGTTPDPNRENSEAVQNLRSNAESIDFDDDFWSSISFTKNLNYLNNPVQIHHAADDPVVNIGYSRDLKEEMDKENKDFELFEYPGGGHNINSPYFEQAIQRTADFFEENL